QGSLTFYPVAPFQILAQWLKLIQDNTTDTAENLLNEAQNISPILADFLHQADWEQTWQKLQQNHRSAPEQRRAFHIWFDGLKTLRLIHALCDATPRDQAEQIVPELFCWGKIAQAETLPAMLEQLRQQQQGKTLNSRT
ncbi:MAG: hypothetical protein OET90_02985, partial [Desulfuromonadales bacterium]|nr:hypothetical protein [Desulfuromonadales bacterium]